MKRVLVADDNLSIRELLKGFFEHFFPEYVVEETVDGLQALEKLDASSADGGFDLVISDIEMPKMTGLELAKRIKQQFPQLPIILLSGAFKEYEKEVLVLEVSGYLSKPFDLKKLESYIQKILGV